MKTPIKIISIHQAAQFHMQQPKKQKPNPNQLDTIPTIHTILKYKTKFQHRHISSTFNTSLLLTLPLISFLQNLILKLPSPSIIKFLHHLTTLHINTPPILKPNFNLPLLLQNTSNHLNLNKIILLPQNILLTLIKHLTNTNKHHITCNLITLLNYLTSNNHLQIIHYLISQNLITIQELKTWYQNKNYTITEIQIIQFLHQNNLIHPNTPELNHLINTACETNSLHIIEFLHSIYHLIPTTFDYKTSIQLCIRNNNIQIIIYFHTHLQFQQCHFILSDAIPIACDYNRIEILQYLYKIVPEFEFTRYIKILSKVTVHIEVLDFIHKNTNIDLVKIITSDPELLLKIHQEYTLVN